MRIEEIIGQRIAETRDAADVSQTELGARLDELLGRAWSRQAVSAAEKGRRAFTAAELIAVAYALEVPIIALLTPPFEVTELELPSGKSIPYSAGEGGPALPAQVLESLRRLEDTAARRAALEREERGLVDRLIGRLAEADLNEEDRAAIAAAASKLTDQHAEEDQP